MAKPGRPAHIPAGVNRDFHDPGLFAGRFFQGGKRAVDLDEGFLYGVLRQRAVLQLSGAQPQERYLVHINNSPEYLIQGVVRVLGNIRHALTSLYVYNETRTSYYVKNLQLALYNEGYKRIGIADGIFETKTLNAVNAFQGAKGLIVDSLC